MSVEWVLALLPVYVLVFFRVAGMMIFAPLFGSARIPRRVKLLLAAVLAMGIASTLNNIPTVVMPGTAWGLAVGIGGEIIFGLAMGTILSFTFIATQWAGEIIGQQMGLNLSEVFDPQFGAHGSLIGDLYFMAALVIFLSINGHHAMLVGVRESFEALPLLSVGMNKPLLEMMVGLFTASTSLAIQLAAPMLVTMLVLDLALGFISKTVPQLNVMTAGMSLRGIVGMIVLIVGVGMSSEVIRDAIFTSMDSVRMGWRGNFAL